MTTNNVSISSPQIKEAIVTSGVQVSVHKNLRQDGGLDQKVFRNGLFFHLLRLPDGLPGVAEARPNVFYS